MDMVGGRSDMKGQMFEHDGKDGICFSVETMEVKECSTQAAKIDMEWEKLLEKSAGRTEAELRQFVTSGVNTISVLIRHKSFRFLDRNTVRAETCVEISFCSEKVNR